MYELEDNIVALATTPGRSALNVLRLCGSRVKVLVEDLFADKTKELRANHCFVYNLKNPLDGSLLDQCVVSYFKGPKSFTGQDVVEISTHGGIVVANKIIDVFLSLGCRIANRGEFSYRAFINGKIDLIQAEAITSIIETNSNLDLFFSLKNLSGSLSKKIDNINNELKEIITYMEHELDFNEGEIDFISFDKYCNRIELLIKKTKNILESSFLPNKAGQDLIISIVGKPNAGKSSLFNALLGYDRSIVASVSGTTRDTIDAHLTINGVRVCLVDTAGIRKTKNLIEKEGVKRSQDKMHESDLIVVVDSLDPKKIKSSLSFTKEIVLVQNKIDKNKPVNNKDVFLVSCKNNVGIKALFTHLSTYINKHHEDFLNKNTFTLSKRVSFLLKDCATRLEKTNLLIKGGCKDLAIISSDLHNAQSVFVSTSSPSNKNEIINNIFKGFCVGK